jgi:hypothetical protein
MKTGRDATTNSISKGEELLKQLTSEWNQLNQIISQCLIRED